MKQFHNAITVTVNKTALAVLDKQLTVNGNTIYGWAINERFVFISDTPEEARDKMRTALADGVTF